jgi:hybrid polyketide synthase/nonribosomal peptide synthetase ACE1
VILALTVRSRTLSYFTPEVVRTEPMSHGQARFWFLRQYLDDPTTSNITFFFKMNGAMDPDRISRTLAMICDRHEALRTCFYVKDGVACQGIMRKSAIRLEQCPVADEHGVRAVYEDLQRHVYDIENGDTFRAVLCQVSPTMLYLVIGYHHIAMDGFSWEILFGELQRGYRAGYLPPVPRQYSTWASKQRQEIDSGQLRSERKFWKQEFSTLPQVLPLLPFAKISSRQPLPCYGLNRTSHKVERRITSLVKEQCRAQKVSPFHFHLAVFRTLLHRFTGADDICIGMADANRMDSADVGVIGFLLNLLPLRFRSTQPNLAFTAMLKEARAKGYAALAHSKVPFNTILEDLDVPRTSSHNPLFQAFIEFRQANKITAAEFETDQPQNSTSYSKTAYDITLNVLEDHAGDLTVSIGTQDTLYTEEATGLILRSYVHLLEAFSKEPALPVDKPSLYSDEDVADAIVLGTGPSLTGVWPETLLHQIEAVARDSVSAAAVKDTLGNSLTYRQLLDRVGTIALALDNVGVTEGSHVAVFQSPSSDWICSMLATMWIGAVYVPLDYRQGLERLAQIAQACSPAAILVDSSTRDEVESLACSSHYINVTKLSDISQATDGSYEAKIKARGDKPAVILFTSGTTGTPKGIVLKHSGLRNGIEGLVSRYDIGREVVLQQTAYSFDMSLDEIFVALCSGGTLVVAGKRLRGDSEAIMRLIALEGVTYTRATPAEYSSWLRHGASHLAGNTSWRFAFAGGDRMTNSLRDEFRALGPLEGLRLFNSYGPTEITLSAVKVEVPYRERDERSDGRPIPIGVSMPNYSIYIVDDNTRLVPVGVPGEIVVGGAGVSFGYLGEAKLTDDRFVENPWAPAHWVQNGWTKMYKTGDRGHMASNGDVHFHGRVAGDTQIKLRGIRLELGDIENNILKASEGVLSNIICTLRRDAGTAESDYIVGHVVFAPGRAVPKTEQSTYFANLLARLALPDYMKPAAMVALERLPLTVHQKIDRAAIATLPVEEILAAEKPSCIEGVDVEFSDLEATIADIWLQVLTKGAPRQLSPSSEFFRLGGNSLLLVETQALIRKTLDVSIPLPDLLEATNLGKMSAKVREAMSLGTIDWDEETTPPEVVHSTMDGIRTPPKTTNLEVVLTGATGHLGRHLMPKLLSDPNISKVHCVAVRNTGKLDPNSQGTDKLVVYPGDITHPRLGLSATDFSHLSASADAIVHCAAVRSFFEPYRVLQKANVCSVAEVVKLAGSRRIPIHYMSSGGVLPDDILSSSAAPRSAAAYVPAANGGEGYVASKWAGERMLERAAAATAAAGHLPVHIYRTLGVVSDDHEAVGRLPASLIDEFARAAVRSNTLLDPEGQWTGSFDLISADEVADAICVRLTTSGDASGDPNAGGEAVDFVHLRATVRVENGQQLSDLLEVPAIRDNIGAFGKLAGPQWIGRLKKAGFGWMVAAQDAVLDGRIRSRR